MNFAEIPDEIPAQYLSGFAGFVVSGGEQTEGMDKQSYVYVLNQVTGIDRIHNPEAEGRASQAVLPSDEAGDDALRPDEYTGNIFQAELEAWAKHVLASAGNDE